MSSLREVWTREVAGALEAHADAVVQMAPGHWTFVPRQSAAHVTVQLGDEWLFFDTPLFPAAAPRLIRGWDVLTANASLAGGLKLCAALDDHALRLRAEFPLEEDVPAGQHVRRACTGFAAAEDALATPVGDRAGGTPADDAPAASDVDLEQLCGAAEWAFTMRAPTLAMVQLDVPGTFLQATVELRPDGGTVASVAVLPDTPAIHACAAAAARCLLAATAAIRMVRAAVRPPATTVCFEVVFAQAPTAQQLAHAFAALSVAWSSAAREAEVLARDAHIAQLYLLESAKPHTQAGAQT